MRIKVVYRKNLKMSEGKVAAQVARAVMYLADAYIGLAKADYNIVVLGVSDKKFNEIKADDNNMPRALAIDKGLTEIAPNTETAFAFIEN